MSDERHEIEHRFGTRVRALRTAAGLSQAALAERLAQAGGPLMNHSNLAKLERGTRGIGLGEAFLLAHVLGATVAAMLDDETVMAVKIEATTAEREAEHYAGQAAQARERARAARERSR